MTLSLVSLVFIAVIGLLAIGLYALLVVRHLIKVVVALQILAKGAILGFILAGRINGQIGLGESLALTIIIVDTIVAVIGLSLAVQIRHHMGTLDVNALTRLRR